MFEISMETARAVTVWELSEALRKNQIKKKYREAAVRIIAESGIKPHEVNYFEMFDDNGDVDLIKAFVIVTAKFIFYRTLLTENRIRNKKRREFEAELESTKNLMMLLQDKNEITEIMIPNIDIF